MARITRKAVQMADKKEISPKVSWPAVALAVIGVVVIVVSAIPSLVDHGAQDTLLAVGLSLLGASGIGGVVGFNAPVGRVKVDE